MLIKDFQLIKEIDKNNVNFKPVLLYGPNEGLIRENYLKIKKNFDNGTLEEVRFSGKLISDQPENIIDELQTVSMFSEKKIITIEEPLDKNVSLFEKLFVSIPPQILIIILAGSLTKTSKIRKLFEKSNLFLSCANYEDDLKSKSQVIQKLEKVIQKSLNKDIKNYLIENLSTDRMVSKNEIDKIILFYTDNKEQPKLEKIKLIVNDNSDLALNQISKLTFSGYPSKISNFLSKVFSEGISPVAVIRVLLNYVLRIQSTQIQLKKTINFDNAIKELKPPVFWKDKEVFESHCKKWPINETVSNVNLLTSAELNCKIDYNLANIICERAILNIAYRGKKYFN